MGQFIMVPQAAAISLHPKLERHVNLAGVIFADMFA